MTISIVIITIIIHVIAPSIAMQVKRITFIERSEEPRQVTTCFTLAQTPSFNEEGHIETHNDWALSLAPSIEFLPIQAFP